MWHRIYISISIDERTTACIRLNNNIFASKYVTYMPDKEQLIAQVEAVLTANSKEHK